MPSEALFRVVKRCSRRLGRAGPVPFAVVVVALFDVAVVGVALCPGRAFGTVDGDAEGALGRPPLMLVWTSGGGGFFILVAGAAGLATTAAMTSVVPSVDECLQCLPAPADFPYLF